MHGDGCYKYAQHFSLSASPVPNVHNWSVWRLHGLDPVLSEVFIEICDTGLSKHNKNFISSISPSLHTV